VRVNLIAYTLIDWEELDAAESGWVNHPFSLDDRASWSNDADTLAEVAGRLCYEAWNRPNPATATNEGYIANIIDHKHFSVVEHSSATFLIQGVSRALTHELVRHRHFSFSQVSQRYVDHADRSVVKPPAMTEEEWDVVQASTRTAKEAYAYVTAQMKARGVDKKTRNGAARAVLPEATSTSLVMTGNHRSWREFIDKRYSKFADLEIRNLAELILLDLKKIAPNIYGDFDFKESFGENPVV